MYEIRLAMGSAADSRTSKLGRIGGRERGGGERGRNKWALSRVWVLDASCLSKRVSQVAARVSGKLCACSCSSF